MKLIYRDHGIILGGTYKIEIYGDDSTRLKQKADLVQSKSLQVPFDSYFQLAEKYEIEYLNQNEKIKIKLEGNTHIFYYFLKKVAWHFNLENVSFECIFQDDITSQEADFIISKMRKFVISVTKKEGTSYNYLFCKKCFTHKGFSPLNNKLEIDIVIPVRDTPLEQLTACLVSLEREIELSDKVFVVDDSKNPILTQDFFTDFAFQISIIRGMQEGIGSARNIGATQGNNSLVLFVDSDDYILPGFIAKQRIFHGKNSVIGASGTWLKAFGSSSRIYPQWDNISPLSVISCLPPAGVLMWKREALEELNYFDIEYQIGFEDFDLVARATASKIPIIVLDEILYMYRRGHNSLSQSWSYSQERNLRNKVNLNLKHLCDHEFKEFLDLNSKFGSLLFQSNPDFIFIKNEVNQLIFIRLLCLILYLIPKKLRRSIIEKIEKHAPFLTKFFPRVTLTPNELTSLKRKKIVQRIWENLPRKLKLFLFRKYFENIK